MMVSFDEGGWGFERVVVMERVDATGGESKARVVVRGEGWMWL